MNSITGPIRTGIVGAGLMGRWHAETVKKIGGRVVAVADLDLLAARKLASRFPGALSFASIEQMLEQAKLDVLHICTPTESHVPLAETAIRAGLDLLVEKPLTPTAEETARLLELAEQYGVKLCPVYQFVFQDGALKAKAWLPQIGRIVHMKSTIHSAGGDHGPEERKDQIAADILPHPLSLIQEFSPVELIGQPWLAFRSAPGELHAFSQASDMSLSIEISMNARPTVCVFQVAGTKGTIHLDLFHGYAYLEPGWVSRNRKIVYPFESAARQFWAATANLRGRVMRWEPAYPGLRQLILSFYHSVASGMASPISSEDIMAIANTRDCLLTNLQSIGGKETDDACF